MPPKKHKRRKQKPVHDQPAPRPPCLAATHWTVGVAEGKQRHLEVWIPDHTAGELIQGYVNRRAERIKGSSWSSWYRCHFVGFRVPITKWARSGATLIVWSDRTFTFAADLAHRQHDHRKKAPRQTERQIKDVLRAVPRSTDPAGWPALPDRVPGPHPRVLPAPPAAQPHRPTVTPEHVAEIFAKCVAKRKMSASAVGLEGKPSADPVEDFFQYTMKLLVAVRTMFPKCVKTQDAIDKMKLVEATGIRASKEALIEGWYTKVKPHIKQVVANDDAVILSGTIDILEWFDMKAKWTSPIFGADSKEVFWEYIRSLTYLACLHNESTPEDIRGLAEFSESIARKANFKVSDKGEISFSLAAFQSIDRKSVV